MFYRLGRRFRTVTLLASLLLAPSGCGDPEKPTGTLTGVVTYRGKPVTTMDVEIHAAGTGISTTASLDEAGRFTLEAPVFVGTYSVAVVPRAFADPSAVPPGGVAVPKKVRSLKTSGLTVEVKKGANDVTIEIPD